MELQKVKRRGILYVVSGPSGVGKDAVKKEVLKEIKDLHRSISVTTREPRAGEVDGIDYFYVDNDKFRDMIENEEFLEYVADFSKNSYGTPKNAVLKNIYDGKDTLLVIETNGAKIINALNPESVLIFLVPPSRDELKRRLTKRGTETPEEIERRFKLSEKEMEKAAGYYDYLVVNDTVSECAKEVVAIIIAERRKLKYNTTLIDDIKANKYKK